MKIKVAFFTLDMTMNGATKTLISLLQNLDYSKYDVDVYLGVRNGEYIDDFPKEVNIIDAPTYSNNLPELFMSALKHPIHMLTALMQSRYLKPGNKKIIECEAVSKRMPIVDKQYDVAISYRHYNIDTFYVINNLKANKKYFWIHGEVKLQEDEVKKLQGYYHKYDRIFPVSKTAAQSLCDYFPECSSKIEIAYSRVNEIEIREEAEKGSTFPDMGMYNGVRIFSIGRLSKEKGFALTIDACALLKKSGYDFRLYILGDGPEKESLKKMISDYSLENECILLGASKNPYGYLKDCDIYVQSSYSESYCLAVHEARVLHKPIVATSIPAFREQLLDNHTGLICELNAQDLSNKLKYLIESAEKRTEMSHNLSMQTNTYEWADVVLDKCIQKDCNDNA